MPKQPMKPVKSKKFRVTITFDVDPDEYNGCEHNQDSVMELVEAMFLRDADFPDPGERQIVIDPAE